MRSYLVLMMSLMFISYGAGEVKHTPSEIDDGDTITAWIDTEDDVVKVSFFVCDRESGVCYQPESRSKDENDESTEIPGRYQFEYTVQDGVKPVYRYTLEYENNPDNESKIPKLGVIYNDQEVIDIGGSLYFEVKFAEVKAEGGVPTLGILISAMIIVGISIIYKKK